MSRTIIYEITAVVQTEFVELYEKYMSERHIPDLLATGHFSSAYFTRSAMDEEENRYRIQYHARNQASLDEYLKKYAERLRADFTAHFPAGVELSREVWKMLQFRQAGSQKMPDEHERAS